MVKKQNSKFPSGRTRLEPVGILIMSILMIILSCSVVFGSGFTLYGMYIFIQILPLDIVYGV